MSRIRSVHPTLFTDEAFVALSDAAKVLYIGLWCEADDHGAFEWKPITLNIRLLPTFKGSVPDLLAELVAHNCVRRYEHGGREYGLVRNFCRFQRPKKPKYVHFIPDEFRTYVGLSAAGTEPHPASSDLSSEPEADERAPVPKKGELGPQMEEGGGRMEEEEGEPLQPVEDGSALAAQAPRRAPAEALAPDWQPNDIQRAYAAKMGLSEVAIGREAIRFHGWWSSGKGAGSRRTPKGWNQAWMNWVAKAVERTPLAPQPRYGGGYVPPGVGG